MSKFAYFLDTFPVVRQDEKEAGKPDAVRTGNFVYFDTDKVRIEPEHIMASGALPPAFPSIRIEGEYYWDGGVVSNTPLQYLLDQEEDRSSLVFQVDLFGARGVLPRSMPDVLSRHKDIMYSSRTRQNTDNFKRIHASRCACSMRRNGCLRSCERRPRRR